MSSTPVALLWLGSEHAETDQVVAKDDGEDEDEEDEDGVESGARDGVRDCEGEVCRRLIWNS